MTTIRAFIAFELDDDAKKLPNRLLDTLQSADVPELTLEDRRNLHVTTNFLGDIREADVEHILNRMRHVADLEQDGIGIVYSGVGAFPDTYSDPRLFYLSVGDGRTDAYTRLADFHKALGRATLPFLQSTDTVGFRKYEAHVTLARFPRDADVCAEQKQVLGAIKEAMMDILRAGRYDRSGTLDMVEEAGLYCTFRRIALMKSIRNPDGSIVYERVGYAEIT